MKYENVQCRYNNIECVYKHSEFFRRLRNKIEKEGEELTWFAFDMRSGQTLAGWNISICFQHTWCLKTLKQMVIGWVGGWVGGGCVSDDTRWHRKHRWATDRCQWSQRCWVEMSNLVRLFEKVKLLAFKHVEMVEFGGYDQFQCYSDNFLLGLVLAQITCKKMIFWLVIEKWKSGPQE